MKRFTDEQILKKRWTGKTLGRYYTNYLISLMTSEPPTNEDLRQIDTISAAACKLSDEQQLDFRLYTSVPKWFNNVGMQARWQMDVLLDGVSMLVMAAGAILVAGRLKHIINIAKENLQCGDVLFMNDKLQIKLTELTIPEWWEDEQKRRKDTLQAWSWLNAHNYVIDLIAKTLKVEIEATKEDFSEFYRHKELLDSKVLELKKLAEELNLPEEKQLKEQIRELAASIFTLPIDISPCTKAQDKEALKRIKNFTAFNQGGELQRIYSKGGFRSYGG